MLHLFTHAFFKACLFLGAGAVIHSLHQAQHKSHTTLDVQDIRNLGGLQKKLPFTFIVFILSGSALAGLPLFTGFLSKDAILNSLLEWKGSDLSWRWLIFGAAFLVSFVTVLYTFRLIWSVFRGEEKLTTTLSIEEPPVAMRVPMAILAAASCWLFVSWSPIDFSGWIYQGLGTGESFHSGFLAVVSAAWILLALAFAYLIRATPINSAVLLSGFYLDRLYRLFIESPAFQLAQFTDKVDKKWIDGLLHTSAYAQLIVAHVSSWFDRVLVDGVVDGAAGLTRGVGSFARSFQSGKIQLYIFWAVFAIIIFIIWTLL
jgi:NADH-quinone oxidoreductase subunit L